MKKRAGSKITGLVKRIFNIRGWVDYDRLNSFAGYLKTGVQRMFVPRKAGEKESFAAVVRRMNLSGQDIVEKQKGLYRLSILMSLVALFMFGYTGYHIFFGSFKAVVISLVVMGLALVMAFRYHFWYYQIKKRKLGCTIREWYRYGLLGGKHE